MLTSEQMIVIRAVTAILQPVNFMLQIFQSDKAPILAYELYYYKKMLFVLDNFHDCLNAVQDPHSLDGDLVPSEITEAWFLRAEVKENLLHYLRTLRNELRDEGKTEEMMVASVMCLCASS